MQKQNNTFTYTCNSSKLVKNIYLNRKLEDFITYKKQVSFQIHSSNPLI
jgi:hypothetical protein